MKARRLIVVSVIGAAAVGGALTGTTVASYRDSAAVQSPPLRTGGLGLSAGVPQPFEVIEAQAPGTAVVKVAASGEGKHLTTATLIESVTVSGAAVDLDLKFRPRQGAGDDCSGGPYTPWQEHGTGGASPVRIGAEGRPVVRDVCVKAELAGGGKGIAVGRHDVSVVLGIATRQVQGGQTVGWAAEDSAAVSGTVLVRPKAPTWAGCTPSRGSEPDLRFDWSAVTGADEYRVYRVDGPSPVLLAKAGPAARALTVPYDDLGTGLESSRYQLRSARADDESLGGREFTLSSSRRGWRC